MVPILLVLLLALILFGAGFAVKNTLVDRTDRARRLATGLPGAGHECERIEGSLVSLVAGISISR